MVTGGASSLLFVIAGALAVYLRYLETRTRNDSEIIKERISSAEKQGEFTKDRASEFIEGINLILKDISEPVRKAVTVCTLFAALYGVLAYILQISCAFLTYECMGSMVLLITQVEALLLLSFPLFYFHKAYKSLERDHERIHEKDKQASEEVTRNKLRREFI